MKNLLLREIIVQKAVYSLTICLVACFFAGQALCADPTNNHDCQEQVLDLTAPKLTLVSEESVTAIGIGMPITFTATLTNTPGSAILACAGTMPVVIAAPKVHFVVVGPNDYYDFGDASSVVVPTDEPGEYTVSWTADGEYTYPLSNNQVSVNAEDPPDRATTAYEISSFTITDATQIGDTTKYITEVGSGNVTIEAVLNPSATASELPSGFVSWTGGAEGDDQLHHVVSKAAAVSSTVQAAVGTSSETANIIVMQIDIKNNSTIITDQSIVGSIGEKFSLSVVLDPPFPNATTQWTVPGNVIKKYVITRGSSATVTQLPASDLTLNALEFFWIEHDSQTILVDISIPDGPTFEAQAEITIERPESTFTATTDSVHVGVTGFPRDGNTPWLSFGTFFHRGISFAATFTPTPATGGTTEFWQVINSTHIVTSFSPPFANRTTTGTNVLDTYLPYPMRGYLITSDSPGDALFGRMTHDTRSDTFTMYYMFKSNKPHSIFVPLKRIDWDWSGTATKTSLGWRLDPGSSFTPNPPSSDVTEEPTWATVAPNGIVTN